MKEKISKQMKNLEAFTVLCLMVSSTITFPALAAEQLSIATNNDDPYKGLFGWLHNLLAKLFGWEMEEGLADSNITTPLPSRYFEPSQPKNQMLQSLKSLEKASVEYYDNFNNTIYKSNFIHASETFISSSHNFSLELEQSQSSIAIELKQKLNEFTEEVITIKEKAEKNAITQRTLNQLIDDISNAIGKRYEKVDFDKYEEREIHPRVLGAGGEVIVAGGQLTLPPSVNSSEPLPEDYNASIDAPITPEIQALAEKLGNDPAKIYWWVHDNVRYQPYYGTMHGAQQTLISRSGNDIDTASLLISLLRASGHPTRYVYGEAYATRNEVFDLLGVDEVSKALRLLWGAGVPAEFDGYGFVIERVWVETYVEPRPYMDRKHWIQLDASWKLARNYTKISQYVSVTSTINATELQQGALQNAVINETAGYIMGINTSFIDSYTSSHVQTNVLQNITEEFFIPEEIIPGEVYLPLSMQFDFNKSYEYSILPDPLKYKVTLSVDTEGNNLLQYENNLSQMAGLPFVLDFAPSTQNDSDKLENGSYPAYEINMTPMIYLGNDAVNGSNVILGTDLNVTLNLSLIDTTTMTKFLYAGEKSAIVIDAPRTEFLAYNKTFERVRAFQDVGDNETLAREGLYLIGSNFFLSSDFYTDALADSSKLRWSRAKPASVFVTKEKSVESFEGMPIAVSEGGASIDLKYDQTALSSDLNISITFNLQRGLTVSNYERTVLEAFYENVTGISTVSILDKALAEDIPLYVITQDTLERLDSLQIPLGDKEIIRGLLLESPTYIAIVPAETVSVGNWRGTGYVIIDMATGAGKYLVSGGLSGGITDKTVKAIKTITCASLTLAGYAAPVVTAAIFLILLRYGCAALVHPAAIIACALLVSRIAYWYQFEAEVGAQVVDVAVGAIIDYIRTELVGCE